MVEDPDFRAAADLAGLDLDPVQGAQIQATVEKMLATPKATTCRARRAPSTGR
jgi:hypothetical protein